ncbi:2-oxoglutarate dehydrogenase, E2 component, dihydrolipoamide succinyltransferase [Mumia sp. DW29H23]|uniref:2-oxoglutarate dehydrogenase, E2 component, dihydrolipoamide succinyltransferase n=1 Tax=Mumia sp. DW29H23 TaxID=3421241 RepID=UPI003D69DE9D
MATPVTLPELGESVTEGTVTRWLKQVGDTVAVDEPLLEVSTDKVDTEIPSPVAGVLLEIAAAEDETVEVGAVLATIGEEGESAGDAAPAADEAPAEEAPAAEAPAEEQPAQEQAPAEEAPEEPAGESSTPPADDTTPAVAAEQEAESAEASAPSGGSGGSGDATPVTLPELGESVTEGTVTRWLKQVGDEVAVDEPLLEVSTDKVDTEIPSPVAGTLLEISAGEDETVEVGAQLALIGSAGSSGGSAPAEAPAAPAEPEPAAEPEQTAPQQAPAQQQEQPAQQEAPAPQEQPAAQEQPAQQEAPAQQEQPAAATTAPSAVKPDGRQYVTPIVRKLAEREGVALDEVSGTGVGGRIRKQDVLDAAAKAREAAAAAAAPAPSAAPAAASTGPDVSGLAGTVKKANRIRQLTAIKTKESLQVAAQLTQVHEVDLTRIAALRAKHKASFLDREGVKLTYLPFIAKATVEALKAHPNVNASYDEESKEITYHAAINLGIAVDTERGLLSVVVHDAGDLSLAGLAQRINDLATRARSGDIKPNELSGGTFTITNIGSFGGLFDTPILVQPQAAMLATGAVVKRPVVVSDADGNDAIAIRSMAYLPMTYDHRLVDGADAGRFLTTVKKRLEEGAFEAELG